MAEDEHPVLDGERRLRVLASSALLAPKANPAYARVARLASELIGAPLAAVNAISADLQHVAGEHGTSSALDGRPRTQPLDQSLCKYVVGRGVTVAIADTRNHALAAEMPTLVGLGVRAYLGVPIEYDGEVLGALCVADTEPHVWSPDDVAALTDLVAIIVDQIQLDVTVRESTERVATQRQRTVTLSGDVLRELSTSRVALELGDGQLAKRFLDSAIGSLEELLAQSVQQLRVRESHIDLPARQHTMGTDAPPAMLPEESAASQSAPGHAAVISAAVSGADIAAASSAPLSPREREVVTLLTQGRSNREIANLLGISVDTTKKHVSSVLKKMGVSSRAAAISRSLAG